MQAGAGRVDIFRTIVAVLKKHKDLQLVLSVGDRVDIRDSVDPVFASRAVWRSVIGAILTAEGYMDFGVRAAKQLKRNLY
jgi:hypothetical protein